MNVQREFMLHEFDLGQNSAEATKKKKLLHRKGD